MTCRNSKLELQKHVGHFPYLCSDSKYTGHVETSFHKIIDVDSQSEFLQPVKQLVIVSHLENRRKTIRPKRHEKLQHEAKWAHFTTSNVVRKQQNTT